MLYSVVRYWTIKNLSNGSLNGDLLRKVRVKIGLEKIDIQERVMVETLLDSDTIGLVLSSKSARKQKLKDLFI